jgi:putative ABC transport system substrate-binding protein
MRRRQFITLLGGAAAWPLAARAQPTSTMRRIGVLMGGLLESDPEGQARVLSFREGLQKLGWTAGGNLRIDYRWAGDDPAHLRPYAAELVALAPDVLVSGGHPAAMALHLATKTIPVVFVQANDLMLLQGIIASLARPGGNLTGFAARSGGTKTLELLKEIAPRVTRMAYVYDPANPTWSAEFPVLNAAAPSLDVKAFAMPVRDAAEIGSAFAKFAGEPNGGLIALASPAVNRHRDLIVALAAQHGLPAVYGYRYYVAAGGLASYGFDNIDLYGRAASYVDRILRGEKAADLPVQLPDKYELVINLRATRAIGLQISPLLLARADEVIE